MLRDKTHTVKTQVRTSDDSLESITLPRNVKAYAAHRTRSTQDSSVTTTHGRSARTPSPYNAFIGGALALDKTATWRATFALGRSRCSQRFA